MQKVKLTNEQLQKLMIKRAKRILRNALKTFDEAVEKGKQMGDQEPLMTMNWNREPCGPMLEGDFYIFIAARDAMLDEPVMGLAQVGNPVTHLFTLSALKDDKEHYNLAIEALAEMMAKFSYITGGILDNPDGD